MSRCSMDVKKLNEKFSNCNCQKEHKCDIEFVKVERGAVNSLKDLTKDYKKAVLVYDENTYNLLGKKIDKWFIRIGLKMIDSFALFSPYMKDRINGRAVYGYVYGKTYKEAKEKQVSKIKEIIDER